MAKFIKAARFLAEDENGFVIGEADTYEEAQAFGGRVIDTQSTENVFQSRRAIKSSISADELSAFSHEIAKGVISEKISLQEAVSRVMKELNCNEKYALSCVYSWIEKEPNYNGMVMTNSRRAVKSSRKIISTQEPLYWGDEHDQRGINMYTREEYIEKYGEEPPEWKRVTETETDLWSSCKPIKSSKESFRMDSYITGRDHITDFLGFSCDVVKDGDRFEWSNLDSYYDDEEFEDPSLESKVYGVYDNQEEFLKDVEEFLNSEQGQDIMREEYEKAKENGDVWSEDGLQISNSCKPITSEKAKFAVEVSDWSGNVVDSDYFDDEEEATSWANSHGKNTHACLWDNENETIIKEWEIQSSRKPVESTNYNNLEKELVTKILSGKLNEEKAARIIAMSKKCNLGYAKQILSTWIEERSPSLIKNGVRHVVLNNAFDPDGNIDSWSMDFVPQSGMADTKAGEILRAFNQIQCSWFNHGYKVGDYKGSEYVNSAARFLKSHTDEKISKLLESATKCHDIESYDNMIQSMKTSLENYLCNNSHLFQSVNEEDMWDEFSPEDNDSGELDDIKLVNGNSFIQFKNEDGSWVCTKINVDTEYNEGDTFTLEDDIAENFEAGDGEYGDFVSEGIHYSWESLNDNEYRINAVSFEDDYFVEDSDYTSDEIIAYCADNPNWVLCNKDNNEVDMDYFN